MDTAGRIGEWDHAKPSIATVIGGSAEGFVTQDSSGRKLIVIDTGLTTFCHLFAKIFSACVVEETSDSCHVSLDPEHIHKASLKNEISKRLDNLLVAFCVRGDPSLAEPYLPSPNQSEVIDIVRDSIQSFIIAHECGHIQNGHLDDPHLSGGDSLHRVTTMISDDVPIYLYRKYKEFEADSYGLQILLNSINFNDPQTILRACGPFLFLIALDILEKFLFFLQYKRDMMLSPHDGLSTVLSLSSVPTTHPTPAERLYELQRRANESDSLPEEIVNIIDFTVETVDDALQSMRMRFQEEHESINFFPNVHPRWEKKLHEFELSRLYSGGIVEELLAKNDKEDRE